MFNAQNRIRQLMAERGWTIYRLAQESGLSQTTISNIFKRNNQPSLPTVNAICDACGITLAQFFTENDTANALRFDPKDSELNMYAILAMGFQGNLSMAQTYYTAAKPYLALEHAEVIKKYLHIK